MFRGTRDGFTSKAFDSKCDGKKNTVTNIKNNLNYVLGGYTSQAWDNARGWISDKEAFIFSLKRNGESKKDIFKAESSGDKLSHILYFGRDNICIFENSNINRRNYSDLGSAYETLFGLNRQSEDSRNYFCGTYSNWLTMELEVYQII